MGQRVYKKKTNNKTKADTYTQEDILNAIKNTGGVIRQIAKKLKCSRNLTLSMIENNEVLLKALKDERENISDISEEQIITGISHGDTNLAKWWLSKMAKDRGFGEEAPIVNVTTQTVNNTDAIKQNLDKLSLEEREMYFELCEKMNNDTDSE